MYKINLKSIVGLQGKNPFEIKSNSTNIYHLDYYLYGPFKNHTLRQSQPKLINQSASCRDAASKALAYPVCRFPYQRINHKQAHFGAFVYVQ